MQQKSLFKSNREKYLWCAVFLVCLAIFSTLFISSVIPSFFLDEDIQATVFGLGMLLICVFILGYGILKKTNQLEWIILLGIGTVYLLLFLRLGLPERSHLMEYSVLALLIHAALEERKMTKAKVSKNQFWAFCFAFGIGIMDEAAQLFLPHRFFDWRDILFNGLAIGMALGGSWILRKARKALQLDKF